MSLAERRQIILTDALRAADTRRRRRLAGRAAVAACVVGAIAFAFAFPLLNQPKRDPTIAVEVPQPAPTTTPVPPTPTVIVQVIRAGDVKPRWEVLSDEQFLAAMADAGRPSGVVTINGKSVIVPVAISPPLPRTRGRGSG